MSGKQKEGDNQRRRTLARRAVEQGQRASEAEATLGSSKQFEHASGRRRSGPPPAGDRKPKPQQGEPSTPPPPAAQTPVMDAWVTDLTTGDGRRTIRYKQLVEETGRRAGIGFDQAKQAAEATVIALARALDAVNRERLLAAMPNALHDDYPKVTPHQPRSLVSFLDDVARMTLRSREQARYRAQAALNALADQDGELLESLDIPTDIRDLLAPQPTGGGLVEGRRHVAALTDAEIRSALAELPYWTGDRRALVRTLVLPPDNLDRVIARLDRLRAETGRAPHIERRGDTAIIVARTQSVDAVTALDVELAHAIDAALEEVGAGIA